MSIKRTEVGFSEDYVRRVAKKERANMIRIMRKNKQGQKELGIWTRDDAGNLIRNDEVTKEAIADPSRTMVYCPYCKEDNEVDAVRGGIYGSSLGEPIYKCVVCGREFDKGSTKKAQTKKTDKENSRCLDCGHVCSPDCTKGTAKNGSTGYGQCPRCHGDHMVTEKNIGYEPGNEQGNGYGRKSQKKKKKYHCSNCNKGFWGPNYLTNYTNDSGSCSRDIDDCPNCPDCGNAMTAESTEGDGGGGITARKASLLKRRATMGKFKVGDKVVTDKDIDDLKKGNEYDVIAVEEGKGGDKIKLDVSPDKWYSEWGFSRPYGVSVESATKKAQRTVGTRWTNEIKRLVDKAKENGDINIKSVTDYVRENLPSEVFDTWEGAYNEIENIVNDLIMGRNSRKAKMFFKKTAQIEPEENTGAGGEEQTVSTATISLGSRGEYNLSNAKEKKLPYDMTSTEVSEEFWTLVTEELDTIHNHPDISEIQWRKGEGLSPTYSEVYAFFLQSLDPLDYLSDNKTKVKDISGMLWLEAFATMHDNSMIEVTVDSDEGADLHEDS